MENHIFHEDTHTFEPISTKCEWCHNQIESTYSNLYVPLFRVNKKLNIIIYKKIVYNKIYVGIPRCQSCEKKHDNQSTYLVLAISTFVIAYLTLLFALFGTSELAIVLIVASMFPFTYICFYLYNLYQKKKNIVKPKNIIKEDILINSFLANGWSLKSPILDEM